MENKSNRDDTCQMPGEGKEGNFRKEIPHDLFTLHRLANIFAAPELFFIPSFMSLGFFHLHFLKKYISS